MLSVILCVIRYIKSLFWSCCSCRSLFFQQFWQNHVSLNNSMTSSSCIFVYYNLNIRLAFSLLQVCVALQLSVVHSCLTAVLFTFCPFPLFFLFPFFPLPSAPPNPQPPPTPPRWNSQQNKPKFWFLNCTSEQVAERSRW